MKFQTKIKPQITTGTFTASSPLNEVNSMQTHVTLIIIIITVLLELHSITRKYGCNVYM